MIVSAFLRPAILAIMLSIGFLTGFESSIAVAQTASGVSAQFPEGQAVVEVPFIGDSDMVIIEVSVNGAEPGTFILDTGTPGSIWLSPKSPGPYQRQGNRFDLGGLEVSNASFMVIDGTSLGTLPFDGILGSDVFAGLVVEINWQQRIVRFHDPEHFIAPTDVQTAVLEDTGGYYHTQATVNIDGKASDVNLFVDTGAGYALTLRENKVNPPSKVIPDVTIGKGLHGPLKGSFGRVDRFLLAETSLDGVISSFVDASTMIIAGPGDGGLGIKVLSRFVVFLDIPNGQLLLRPAETVDDPFDFSMTGIQMQSQLDEDGFISVLGVYRNSPAERASIKTGDQIVRVNDLAVEEIGLKGLKQQFRGNPGDTITLEVKTGLLHREVTLILEQLL